MSSSGGRADRGSLKSLSFSIYYCTCKIKSGWLSRSDGETREPEKQKRKCDDWLGDLTKPNANGTALDRGIADHVAQ